MVSNFCKIAVQKVQNSSQVIELNRGKRMLLKLSMIIRIL